MRKDWVDLTREGQKNDTSEQDRRERMKKGEPLRLGSADGRLYYALDVAQVLAEFGDSSAYEIVAKVAVQDKSAAKRGKAIEVLAELGRLDKVTLQARGCDPEAALLAVAESETEPHLWETVFGAVMSRMRPESALRILEKVERSSHLSAQGRQIVSGGLKDIRRQLEKEKQAGGPKNK
jgi:hypothetical protein